MIFHSNKGNVVGKLLETKAAENINKPFLYFEDQVITYGEMNENSNKVANGFIQMGIKQGDNVAVMMENSPEYLYTSFALSKIGAVEIPINNFHKGDVLQYQINISNAKIVVADDGLLFQIKDIEKELKNVEHIIVNGSKNAVAGIIPTASYDNLTKFSSNPPDIDIKHSDLLTIMFTSGTTGPSKGVMITHNQAVFVGRQYVNCLRLTEDDIGYLYIPLFHMAPKFIFTIATVLSSSAVVMKKNFSASTFWDEIIKYNCTYSGMFEAVLKILNKVSEKPDDSENPIRAFVTAHIPAEIHEPFEKRFGVKLVNVYGMTEGDCTISATLDDIRVGSCGKPRGYFEIKIVDENDQEVPAGRVGEIIVRPIQPYTLFEGYYRMPEKTLKAFRNLWFHTGDLAYQDEDGYFFFVAREKDMIRRGGENISALEVEKILESHPKVNECAAIAVPSDIWGEEVKVSILPKENEKIDLSSIVAYCDERMAYFMIPRYLEIVDEIPKTEASQRPRKELLKEINSNTWDRIQAGVKIKHETKK